MEIINIHPDIDITEVNLTINTDGSQTTGDDIDVVDDDDEVDTDWEFEFSDSGTGIISQTTLQVIETTDVGTEETTEVGEQDYEEDIREGDEWEYDEEGSASIEGSKEESIGPDEEGAGEDLKEEGAGENLKEEGAGEDVKEEDEDSEDVDQEGDDDSETSGEEEIEILPGEDTSTNTTEYETLEPIEEIIYVNSTESFPTGSEEIYYYTEIESYTTEPEVIYYNEIESYTTEPEIIYEESYVPSDGDADGVPEGEQVEW